MGIQGVSKPPRSWWSKPVKPPKVFAAIFPVLGSRKDNKPRIKKVRKTKS